jgi:23S rRNA pseudouridine2605 synthase
MNQEPNPNNPPEPDEAQVRSAETGATGRRAGLPAATPGGEEALSFDEVVSGAFDAEQAQAEPAAPAKRVLAPQAESPKLHKVLAQAGMGSRLEMEQLILEGRISVNNEPAHIGQRIQYGDSIKVNGKPVRVRIAPPPPRVLAYHKPAGEVVTHDDPQNRPTVFRRLPRLQQGKWQSVGRLDINTEGLLLLTSSGELANRLMHPRFGLQREYAARVLGALSNEEKKRLLEGVTLDDGPAQFASIEDGGGDGANCWYRVTIAEGRNREVRRMFEAVGHAVSRLIRIRYGAVMLPRGLRRGTWVELDARDIDRLTAAAGLPAQTEDEIGRAHV